MHSKSLSRAYVLAGHQTAFVSGQALLVLCSHSSSNIDYAYRLVRFYADPYRYLCPADNDCGVYFVFYRLLRDWWWRNVIRRDGASPSATSDYSSPRRGAIGLESGPRTIRLAACAVVAYQSLLTRRARWCRLGELDRKSVV